MTVHIPWVLVGDLLQNRDRFIVAARGVVHLTGAQMISSAVEQLGVLDLVTFDGDVTRTTRSNPTGRRYLERASEQDR